MQIYIADLQAYNSGYLKGEWIKLPTEAKTYRATSQYMTGNFHLK